MAETPLAAIRVDPGSSCPSAEPRSEDVGEPGGIAGRRPAGRASRGTSSMAVPAVVTKGAPQASASRAGRPNPSYSDG